MDNSILTTRIFKRLHFEIRCLHYLNEQLVHKPDGWCVAFLLKQCSLLSESSQTMSWPLTDSRELSILYIIRAALDTSSSAPSVKLSFSKLVNSLYKLF